MYPFSFQKGNKAAGCEDAPPVARAGYSIVCDGLGGAGSTKHAIFEVETQKTVTRTSGYLGSRIVCDCVSTFFENNFAAIARSIAVNGRVPDRAATVSGFLCDLKAQISQIIDEHIKKWGIKPSLSKTLKDFPTTLASAIYFVHPRGITVLSIWAGDSRVYVLTPSKGLQLLSLDDAKGAEDEMNSASEMNNCISAGNNFHLNYAIYDLDEPGLVFCCSDGCFDYLKSPLHFEWLLLHTMLECMPSCDTTNIGNVLADSIRDNMYRTIGDDTTMAGVIIGINSTAQIKNLFQARKSKSDKHAIAMNGCLEELKKIQSERDSARKKCSLIEEKILTLIHDEICLALRSGNSGSHLRSRLTSMPCFTDYIQREKNIEHEVDEECEAELRKAQESAYQLKNVCRNMLILDYIKWRNQSNAQNQSHSPVLEQFLGISSMTRSPVLPAQSNTGYMDPEKVRQAISACIEMIKHPSFKEIVFIPSAPNDELDQYLRGLTSQLEVVHELMGNTDSLFYDLWSQAFFSTDDYLKERHFQDRNPQFELLFEQTMSSPQSSQFASALSKRKIVAYNDQTNRTIAIHEKFSHEKQRRLADLPENFWSDHKNEILDMVFSESDDDLCALFPNSTVQSSNLISYTESKRVLQNTLSKIGDVQRLIDGIWAQYKQDYQLILQISEKGAC